MSHAATAVDNYLLDLVDCLILHCNLDMIDSFGEAMCHSLRPLRHLHLPHHCHWSRFGPFGVVRIVVHTAIDVGRTEIVGHIAVVAD